MVTQKFESCGKNELCNCAVYIRVNDASPRYVFIDHCYAKPEINNKFKYFDESLVNELKTDSLPLLECNYTMQNDNNDTEWAQIPLTNNFFKCAKLVTSSSCQDNYVVYF